MTDSKPDLPILPFASQAAWEAWLAEQTPAAPGVWLKLAKKGSTITSVSIVEAVESALCYGWIDGLARRFDADSWLLRFTPRRPRSNWSATNRARALALIEAGRMQPAGMAEIERARADGRWEAAQTP